MNQENNPFGWIGDDSRVTYRANLLTVVEGGINVNEKHCKSHLLLNGKELALPQNPYPRL